MSGAKLQAAAGFGAAASMSAPTVVQAIQDLCCVSFRVGIALIGGGHSDCPVRLSPPKAKTENVCAHLPTRSIVHANYLPLTLQYRDGWYAQIA